MLAHEGLHRVEPVGHPPERVQRLDREHEVPGAGEGDRRRQRRVELVETPAQVLQRPADEQRGRLADPRLDGGERRRRRGRRRPTVTLTGTSPSLVAERLEPAGVGRRRDPRRSATPLAIVACPQNGTSASGLK